MKPAPKHTPRPDPRAMATAIKDLLQASGLPPECRDLRVTPRRVARFWCEEFLAGYRQDPATILWRGVAEEDVSCALTPSGLIVVTGLRFHSMCPHHLLPSYGTAAVAYVPSGRLFGFGQIARLVDCLTQRLTLQEHATREIAQALMDHGGTRGAGCVLRAVHLCLALPGDRHDQSEVVTSSFVGILADRKELQRQLLAAARGEGKGQDTVPNLTPRRAGVSKKGRASPLKSGLPKRRRSP